MKKKIPTKSINVRLPADLYDMYSKICIDYGITRTEGLIQYLKYLKEQKRRKKTLLTSHSIESFELKIEDNED